MTNMELGTPPTSLTKRSSQRLHCVMFSMSILASVIKPAATCAPLSRG